MLSIDFISYLWGMIQYIDFFTNVIMWSDKQMSEFHSIIQMFNEEKVFFWLCVRGRVVVGVVVRQCILYKECPHMMKKSSRNAIHQKNDYLHSQYCSNRSSKGMSYYSHTISLTLTSYSEQRGKKSTWYRRSTHIFTKVS